MKLNKLIAKGLSIGLLLNSVSILSYANMEIPNRYQTLEGEYITIDDSIEGNLEEIEIFGNTVQDPNNLEDIQSIGDLYVDENGNPILDKQGREQYKIEVVSQNKNLFDTSNEWAICTYAGGRIANEKPLHYNFIDNKVVVKNQYIHSNLLGYKLKYFNDNSVSVSIKDIGYTDVLHYACYSRNWEYTKKQHALASKKIGERNIYTLQPSDIPDGTEYILLGIGNHNIANYEIEDIMIEYGGYTSDYNSCQNNKIEILLPTQLQKVGNVADRLYWDNEKGRYVIEKNIGEFSSEWLLSQPNLGTTYHQAYAENYNNNEMKIGLTYTNEEMFRSFDILPVYNTLFSPINTFSEANGKKEGSYTRYSGMIRLWIDSERLKDLGVDFLKLPNNSEILSKQKLWLENNPTTFYYISNNLELIETNIISKLKIPTYDEKTHIYVNSENNINPTLKVTVDRLPQIAKEAVAQAENDNTNHNISLARRYINMLPESSYKDQLQEQLSDIFSSDMVLDIKTATSNLDIYIKSENILQMSLDTNQISFEDFSGIEDVEKLNAVNLTINSSLPYQINAYLPSEIQNSDKTKTLDKSILNIKESSSSDYQTFTNTTDKIVLKDNCSAGNQLTHGVDLKLAGGIAHEKDIYKATIKLEVEQK